MNAGKGGAQAHGLRRFVKHPQPAGTPAPRQEGADLHTPTRKGASMQRKKLTKAAETAAKLKAAATAPNMTAADAVIATLIAHGLDTVYALPGLQNDLLFEALFRFSDLLRTIHTRHEQGAAYMALGAALATGKPQTYAVVPGPGLLNSAAALLTAYGMNAPVLALIGQIPAAAIARGDAAVRHAAGARAGLPARPRRARRPQPLQRHAAARPRSVGRGRRGAG